MEATFKGGINIAMKIPGRNYEKTVVFYRDVLNMEVEEIPVNLPTVSRTHKVKFGENILWLDCADYLSHSETWLELCTNDVNNAREHLVRNDIQTCDELEKIPANMHWIKDPAGNVLLLKKKEETQSSLKEI